MEEEIIRSYLQERESLLKDVFANTWRVRWDQKFERIKLLDKILLWYLDKQQSDTKQPEQE